MTMPNERTRAVIRTRDFLIRLAGREIKRIPSQVREEARSLLRHFPHGAELARSESFDAKEVEKWLNEQEL